MPPGRKFTGNLPRSKHARSWLISTPQLPADRVLVLAKELASLDVLSQGRVIFGVGIGYLKPEFDALGIPFEEKGPRTVDYLQAMRALWTQPQPAYHGKFVSFGGV